MQSIKALDGGTREGILKKSVQIILPAVLGYLAYLISTQVEVMS